MRPAIRLISDAEHDASHRAIAARPARTEHNDNHRPESGRATVLLMQADVLVRLDIAALLRSAGYRVIETASADEARAAIATGAPVALAFIDADLPDDAQSADLLDWLHARFPALKVVLASGASHALGGLQLCDSFLPKPYPSEEVSQAVKRILG